MALTSLLNSRLLHHFLFWLFLFGVLSVSSGAREMSIPQLIVHNLGHLAILFPPVYAHFYILDKFFLNRRFAIYFGLAVAILIPSGLAADYIFRTFFNYQEGLFASFYFVGFSLILSSAAKLIKKAVQQKFQLQEVESKQLQTELALLKAQINPHFLFNTLNNLFGLARNRDAAAAEGISRLSHLMRYMIHDSQVDRIELDKEIEQIGRLIELQRLRFSKEDDIDVDFQIQGKTDKIQIPPMLLISFVENAFKHGISLDSSSFIHIILKALDQKVVFSVQNSKYTSPQNLPEPKTGLGLENVKRRLELLFPGKHELYIQETEDTFKINLTIEL
jgi:sensor histidine kinase YesM